MFNKSLGLFFPEPYLPSKQQGVILKKIGHELTKHKFVICCAPTGSGKSLLAKTIAAASQLPTKAFAESINSYAAFRQDFEGNYINGEQCLAEPPFGAFVLTITKSLQDQYNTLFSDTHLLKGKQNYICDVDENFMVDLAPCTFVPQLRDKCWNENRCSYFNARNTALTSRLSVLNYKMFLALPPHVKRKNVIICDEASELEEELVKQFSAEVEYKKLEEYNVDISKLITDNKEKACIWLYNLIQTILIHVEELGKLLQQQPGLVSKKDRIKYAYFKNLHASLSSVIELWTKCEYIIDYDSQRVCFTPLHANVLTSHIFGYAEKVVLLSATIIDHNHFAKSLGITEYAYVEAESEFDSKKSPIYISSTHKLNYKNLKNTLPKVCKQIEEIVEHHNNEKGVIHTHTQEIANFIHDKLGTNERFLFRNAFSTNEDILKKHKEAKQATILVSPSLAYGVDLKDELARFQIIVKLPFLPLYSKRIKKLSQLDKNWYENKMLNSVVQAAGRATRSKNDHSITYILDGTFVDIIKRTKNKLPKHFIDRIH